MNARPDTGSTGLYYLRARYYDPQTGQFLSRDPIAPLTQEPYGYVGGNPLNQGDPIGLGCGWNPVCYAGGGVSTAAGAVAGWGSGAAHWVYNESGTISAVSGAVAVLAAPIPIVGEVVTPIAGFISVSTGVLAGVRNARDGDYLGAGLDFAGASLGLAGLRLDMIARSFPGLVSLSASDGTLIIANGEGFITLRYTIIQIKDYASLKAAYARLGSLLDLGAADLGAANLALEPSCP